VLPLLPTYGARQVAVRLEGLVAVDQGVDGVNLGVSEDTLDDEVAHRVEHPLLGDAHGATLCAAKKYTTSLRETR